MNKIYIGTLETHYMDIDYSKENSSGIALYKIEFNKFQEAVPALKKFLTTNELKRANNYLFAKDKNRFTLCRTLLKFILAAHSGLAIESIVIGHDDNKKPYLTADPSILFNVTHAGNYGIIAIATNEIGIDMEFINPEFSYKEIMPLVFKRPERSEVINSKNQQQKFYQLWTRKEAIVKATGKGIDDHFIEVPALDGTHTITNTLLGDLKNLNVFSFEIDKDHIGAIAFSETTESLDKLSFYDLPHAFNTFVELTENKNRE